MHQGIHTPSSGTTCLVVSPPTLLLPLLFCFVCMLCLHICTDASDTTTLFSRNLSFPLFSQPCSSTSVQLRKNRERIVLKGGEEVQQSSSLPPTHPPSAAAMRDLLEMETDLQPLHCFPFKSDNMNIFKRKLNENESCSKGV